MTEINIYGTLNNATPDGVIAKAEQIKDSAQNKKQSEINDDYKNRIETLEEGSTIDYEELDNKPSINGIELSGNKSPIDLGLQASGDYATKSDLESIKPSIGENGNWYLGEKDTDVPAQGPKGEKGDKGDKGETGATGPKGQKGDQGNSGVSGTTDNIVVVNDLNGGESTPENIKVLAAEQGKVLNEKITYLTKEIDNITNESDELNKIQLAEILDKSTNEGYRIGSTGVETKDSAYNHVSFDALPPDVIIFRGSKAVNIYTSFFLIEKSDGSYESLTVSNQNNNPASVVEVSLSSYSNIKKVHYNDYASNPIEIYKISDGLAYYALSQKLKDTFANRANYYQSVVNVLDPEDKEARKDGLYNTNGQFQQSSSYQAITVPVSFGNIYYVVRKDNGKLITISGSMSYPYFLLDKDKNIIGVVKTGNTQSIFVDDIRCKFLRFSLAGITSGVELGVMTNSTKYSDFGNISEPNVKKDYGEKSNNLFDENNILEKGCLLLDSGYSEQYNMGLIKIPVERGKKYAIFTSNFLDAMYVGIAYFKFDTIGLLTDDNKTLGTVTQIKNLPKNTSGTNCIYTVEETYTVDGETYEGQIYLSMNTKQSQYDITKTIVQEGENITDVHTPYFIRNRVSPSTYTISHIHAGDSISEGTGVSITNIVSDYFRSSFLDVNYFIKNAAVRATAISTAYNWVVNNEEMVKSCNIYSIQYGTNSPMRENAEENAVIPKETFADIPYETDEGTQINTIDEHCARFGNDTYSTYCKFIERVLYLNKKIRLVFISIPEFAENESKHNERVLTNENIKKICKLYSLPYIDAANNAGISYRLTKAYSTDNTHFGNEEGNYLWFTYIATELRKMCNTMFNLEQIKAINNNKFNM